MAKSKSKSSKQRSESNFSLPTLPRLEIGESTKVAILAIFLVVFSLILILGFFKYLMYPILYSLYFLTGIYLF